MNLVNELQVSAEQDDVLTVLRKTKRLASKLGRKDISDWLQAETEGYDGEVPDYRMVKTILAVRTNGYVPAGFGLVMDGIKEINGFDTPDIPVKESVSDIVTTLEGLARKNHGLYYPIPQTPAMDRLRSRLCSDPRFETQLSLLFRLNERQVQSIPEKVKDKVLDWALALEEAGVTGDGMTFSAREKEIAHNVTFNIMNSTIEQLNNQGNNQRGSR